MTILKKLLTRIESAKGISVVFRRDIFALVYTAVMILWSIPLLQKFMDYPSKLCFVWGACLMLWDLLTHRRMFRSVFWGLPLMMIASYCVTMVLNPGAGLYALAKHVIYLALGMLLLYARDRNESEEDLKTLLRRLFDIVIVISLFTALASLALFPIRYSFKFLQNGFVIRQGFLENRLFGIYYSPNAGALFAVVSVAGVLVNWLLAKDRGGLRLGKKILYVADLAVQFLYFSVTLSRGGTLTLFVFSAAVVLSVVLPRLLKKRAKGRAMLSAALALLVAVGGLYAGLEGVQRALTYVDLSASISLPEPDFLPYELYHEDTDTDEPDEDPDKHHFERIEDDGDSSNGRFSIWKGAVKLALRYGPLFGLGDFQLNAENIEVRFPAVRKILTNEELIWMYRQHGNLHNAYIQVFVYSGAAGLLLFLLFALLIFLKILKTLLRADPEAKLYPVAALLFSLLFAMMINALVESHLLFRGPNMFWAIFWTVAGATALLSERLRASDDYLRKGAKDAERFAFAVGSPVQAIHAVNIVSHDLEGCRGSADCYVCHMFAGADGLSERLRASGLFNNVYDLKDFKKYSGAFDKVAQMLRVLFPAAALKRCAAGKLPIRRKVYKHVLMSNAVPFMSCLWLASPGADVWFFDDGIGSYFGDMAARSELFNKIDRFFFEGTKSVKPTRLYLAAPEASRSEMDCETLPLPELTDEQTLAFEEGVFDYKENDLYRTHRFVYLSQPFAADAFRGYDASADAGVREAVASVCGGDAVLRRHPRDKTDYPGGLTEDTFANVWELECVKQISGSSVLIGGFSTAQVMPFILTGHEPTVIFTYKLLFKDLNAAPWPDAEGFIENMKTMVRHPERLCCPETPEELRKLLEKLKDE